MTGFTAARVVGKRGKRMGAGEAAQELFSHLMKFAILFFSVAILYIWVEHKLLKKFKNKRKRGRK